MGRLAGTAALMAALLAAACTSHDRPASEPSAVRQAPPITDVVGQVSPTPTPTATGPICRFDQLGFSFGAGGHATGKAFAGINVRDVSSQRCRIVGWASITPLDASYRVMENLNRAALPHSILLTADAPAPVMGKQRPEDEIDFQIVIAGVERDYSDGQDRDCTNAKRWVPEYWRVQIAGGTTIVRNLGPDANVNGTSSVYACNGSFWITVVDDGRIL